MNHIWFTYESHVIYIWITFTYDIICKSHVIYMWITCESNVIYMWNQMWCTCESNVINMWIKYDFHVINIGMCAYICNSLEIYMWITYYSYMIYMWITCKYINHIQINTMDIIYGKKDNNWDYTPEIQINVRRSKDNS